MSKHGNPQRFSIIETTDATWKGATVELEWDGDGTLHLKLRQENGEEFSCHGRMDAKRRLVVGLWDPAHEFELDLTTQAGGSRRLDCKIHKIKEMTSDSWSADEDGP